MAVPSLICVSVACTHTLGCLMPAFAPCSQESVASGSWRQRAAHCSSLRMWTELFSSRAAASALGNRKGLLLSARYTLPNQRLCAHANARRCSSHGTAACARILKSLHMNKGTAVICSSCCACWCVASVVYVLLCRSRSRDPCEECSASCSGCRIKSQNFAGRVCGFGIEPGSDLGQF